MKKCIFLFFGAFLLPSLSSASSPEEWGEFRRDLHEECISKAERIMHPTQIISDDFGTEHYGVVLFKGVQLGENKFGHVICIRDKESSRTEITEFIIDK